MLPALPMKLVIAQVGGRCAAQLNSGELLVAAGRMPARRATGEWGCAPASAWYLLQSAWRSSDPQSGHQRAASALRPGFLSEVGNQNFARVQPAARENWHWRGIEATFAVEQSAVSGRLKTTGWPVHKGTLA